MTKPAEKRFSPEPGTSKEGGLPPHDRSKWLGNSGVNHPSLLVLG